MKNYLIIALLVAILLVLLVPRMLGNNSLGASESTTITNPWTFQENVTFSTATLTNTTGSTVLATTTVESLTRGGRLCTLTDADGGAYVLTDAQMANCGTFEFAAGGAGQAVIALTFPATSTMTQTIPNAGDCKDWIYDASALAAATTTTLTLGVGHNIIAYTTNDDVIDGAEFSQITMCRRSDTNVNTFVTEMLHAD